MFSITLLSSLLQISLSKNTTVLFNPLSSGHPYTPVIIVIGSCLSTPTPFIIPVCCNHKLESKKHYKHKLSPSQLLRTLNHCYFSIIYLTSACLLLTVVQCIFLFSCYCFFLVVNAFPVPVLAVFLLLYCLML